MSMHIYGSLPRLLWPFRKLFLGIPRDALVLDIGSGNSPNPRSDILFDRLTGPDHRCNYSLIIDRPIVFGDAHELPFRDKSFHYVIASHILEHMSNPDRFISELQRVSSEGYIEVPSAVFESLVPLHVHSLEILLTESNELLIRKKKSPNDLSLLGEYRPFINLNNKWKKMIKKYPDQFHIRLRWKNKINYRVINPDDSCSWIDLNNNLSLINNINNYYPLLSNKLNISRLKHLVIIIIKSYFNIRKRNKKFNLSSIMMCTNCRGNLELYENMATCFACNKSWLVKNY